MTRDEQIAEYNAARAAWWAAQHVLNDARTRMDEAAKALASRMLADVPAEAINRTINIHRSPDVTQECLIVDKRCPSWNPTQVNPVVVFKINKGKSWGKTRQIASSVYWDFAAGDWKQGA